MLKEREIKFIGGSNSQIVRIDVNLNLHKEFMYIIFQISLIKLTNLIVSESLLKFQFLSAMTLKSLYSCNIHTYF